MLHNRILEPSVLKTMLSTLIVRLPPKVRTIANRIVRDEGMKEGEAFPLPLYIFMLKFVVCTLGDTGPYLQYAHARLSSMERKAGLQVVDTIDYSLLCEKEATDLAVQIARLPDYVKVPSMSARCTQAAFILWFITSSHPESRSGAGRVHPGHILDGPLPFNLCGPPCVVGCWPWTRSRPGQVGDHHTHTHYPHTLHFLVWHHHHHHCHHRYGVFSLINYSYYCSIYYL